MQPDEMNDAITLAGKKKFDGFLFDLNGTMINDMPYHIKAWHQILNSLGAGITMERMKAECYGKNDELLERIFPGRFTMAEKKRMGFEKEEAYQVAFRPQLQLLNGLPEFLKRAHQRGIKMAIGSAAILFNIDFVLDNLNIRNYFTAIVSADDVLKSKPDAETFTRCAAAINLPPADCLVFEDTPKGVEAAANAGMKAIVLTTLHQPHEFTAYENIIHFAPDYTEIENRVF